MKDVKQKEVYLVRKEIEKFVVDFLSENYDYDMTQESDEQKEYRRAVMHSAIKAARELS